jgi:hypothetical protein
VNGPQFDWFVAVLGAVAGVGVAECLAALWQAKAARRRFIDDDVAIKELADSSGSNLALTLERELRLRERASKTPLIRARGWAGLLIIGGLLFTLFNLREAVLGMSQSFGPATTTNDVGTMTNPLLVQQSLQNVIHFAGSAFSYSAYSILAAAGLLLLAQACGMYVDGVLLKLRRTFNDRVIDIRDLSSGSLVDRLADALIELAKLTSAFHGTTEAIQELRSLGTNFESAAEQITKAVEKLPEQIGESVDTLGQNVAHGISIDLAHQLEYLKKLVVLYGDQHDTLAAMTESHKASSGALTTVGDVAKSTADALKIANERSAQAAQTNERVVTLIEEVRSKIDALPIEDLQKEAATFSRRAEDIVKLQQEAATLAQSIVDRLDKIPEILSSLGRAIKGSIETGLSDTQAAVDQSLSESQASIMKSLLDSQAAIDKNLTDNLSGPARLQIEQLSAIRADIARLATLVGALKQAAPATAMQDLDNLERQVSQIRRRIEQLPWLSVRRFFGR